ncbi:HNH endonuclease family protein [Corynebacterium sp. ED61]|uniref:HNH endonuclease family protein n=1 Tax=Corynebacterium sp. ED61 TaxID=2211360 RepID=UPI001D166004|nr:HNH endonuclease family protein [Corynebacterium sp. ED61]
MQFSRVVIDRLRWVRAGVLAGLVAVSCVLVSGCSAVLDELRYSMPSSITTLPNSEPQQEGGLEDPNASPSPSSVDTPEPSPAPVEEELDEGELGVGNQGDHATAMRNLLATLEVKGRAPKTGYSRDQFGQRWKDIDRNGCDQRNDVLQRDLHNVDAPKGCKVLSGVLEDPYTGTTINFLRGQDTSAMVQIDHVVAMADAWQKGAQQLSAERREQFANDPLNLLAVDGPANQQKGAGDAATWLPANKAFRCQYVSIQIQVKAEYQLWITPAEHDVMDRELGRC